MYATLHRTHALPLARAQGFSLEDQSAVPAVKPPTTWDVKVLVAALQVVVS